MLLEYAHLVQYLLQDMYIADLFARIEHSGLKAIMLTLADELLILHRMMKTPHIKLNN